MIELMSRIGPEDWLSIAIATFVHYLFADHAVHATMDYARRGGARRLRGFMLGLLLWAGTLGILMGVLARAMPEASGAAAFVRWIAVGMLFVGGITTWITWRWPRS